MRAFPRKGSLSSGASQTSTSHGSARRFRAQDYSVVLLGVMYPSSVQQRHHVIEHDEPTLPPEILMNRRSTDLIFYDPIQNNEKRLLEPIAALGSLPERKEKPVRIRHAGRRASIEAVVRDLTVLFLRKPI